MKHDEKLGATMRRFWDSKARENAMYYISSYRAYDQQDPAEFWKWGGVLAEKFLAESRLAFTGDESMMEIGCGVGRMTRYFSGRFRRVVGVDVSDEMIRQAGESLRDCPNVHLDVVNGVDLSAYADASFDFVFSYIVFQHIPDRRVTLAYIEEIGRVLRAGGAAYFQVNTMPQAGGVRAVLGRLKRSVPRSRHPGEDAAGGPRDLDHPAWVGSRVTRLEVEAAVARGGMQVERVQDEGTQYTWVLARRLPVGRE